MDAHIESTALRFHKRLKRYHRIGFFYNVGSNWLMAAYHFACYVVEAIAVECHQKDIKAIKAAQRTAWDEKKQGVHIRALKGGG